MLQEYNAVSELVCQRSTAKCPNMLLPHAAIPDHGNIAQCRGDFCCWHEADELGVMRKVKF